MSVNYKNATAALLSIYFFISSITLIKSSATIMGEPLAEKISLLIKDTTTGVFAGWLSTAILHSSGAFDSIIVALASSGAVPLSIAVAAIIGAEMGTTITPFLVSVVSHIRKRKRLTASFSVTMSHVLYNLFTLLIFYPAELFFKVFTKVAVQGRYIFVKATWLRAIPDLIDVMTPWVGLLLRHIPPWLGLLLGGATLIASLICLERYMTAFFSMPRSWNLIRATFTRPLRAFAAGFLFTILVPSTTVMVSILVPLADSGVIRADYYILPYILGANIGTVFDVMIAALATGNPVALGIWLVHLTINLVGACIFLPILKPFSALVRRTAETISLSPKRTLFIAVVFHAVPILVLINLFL